MDFNNRYVYRYKYRCLRPGWINWEKKGKITFETNVITPIQTIEKQVERELDKQGCTSSNFQIINYFKVPEE